MMPYGFAGGESHQSHSFLAGLTVRSDLFVPNGTHNKKAKTVRSEPIRVTIEKASKLYELVGLGGEEVAFVEKNVREME